MFTVMTVILAAIGLVLAGGGAWLLVLGGSPYYCVAGLAFLLSAFTLGRRMAASLWIYAAIVAATLGWALYETGLDWWQLMPRGGVVVLVGIALALTATFAREPHIGARAAMRPALAALWLFIVISGGVAVYAMLTPSHDTAGTLPGPEAGGAEVAALEEGSAPGDWTHYGRTAGGDRYSPLKQITPDNAANLEVAWTFHTGDVRTAADTEETTYEVTPLKIGDDLYVCTPHDLAIAIDAVSGKEVWRFDAKIGPSKQRQHQTCRGVSYLDTTAAPASPAAAATPAAEPSPPAATASAGGDCAKRIVFPTSDAKLYELDAATGKPCPSFGKDGAIDLWANMPNVNPGAYYATSPPVVAGGLIVIGGAVNDNVSTSEPSGVIRAFDARSGELVWNFDSGAPERTEPLPSGETYTTNSPNSWSILSVDPELGLVYAPMGNAPPDQYGGDRSKNTERFSATVTALDLKTGKVRWVFQGVHHDLWDMDMPSQPELVDIRTDAGTVPGLVQATKQGEIFVLDRHTGEPILPVTEVAAPTGAVKGDFTAPTQPKSAISFEPKPLEGRDMWGATMFDQLLCRIAFRGLNYGGRFTPPTEKGSIVYPGNFGAFNWGGVAIDPVRQVIVATPVYLAFTSKLIPRKDATTNYVSNGVPGFNENYGAPYAARMGAFLSPLGLPCQAPPWGYIAGVDLKTGKTMWQHVNGTTRDLSPIPIGFKMGVPNIGGPMVTAGGVAFLSGTLDYYVRAYDVTTGRELWQSRLPAGGQATPMSYEGSDGRQYVVVVAGGHGSTGTKPGDAIIAYALPKS